MTTEPGAMCSCRNFPEMLGVDLRHHLEAAATERVLLGLDRDDHIGFCQAPRGLVYRQF